MLKSKRSRLIFAVVVAVLGAIYIYWEIYARREQVQMAWVVEDGGKAYIAAIDRKTGDEDYLILETIAVDGGERVGRSEVGGTSEPRGVQITGPIDGRKALLRYGKGAELFDLIEHTSVPDTGTDASGSLYDACMDGKRAAKGLFNPDLRGCVEGVGLLQHSMASARHDWQASLVEGDGNKRWTVSATQLSGSDTAWFGHGIVVGAAWWVVIVVPSNVDDGLLFVELDAESGKVARSVKL